MRVLATAVMSGVLLVATACGGEPAISDEAERVFVACAGEHGVDVEHVEIGRDEVDVVFADDVPSGAADAVLADCEPRAVATFEGEGAAASALPEVPADVTTVAQYLEHLDDSGFSGAVRVSVGGGDVIAEAYGLADRSGDVASTTGTAFDIGSITKSFTAVAVLRLVDEGVLSLDDTLDDLLADVPTDKRAITVRQLLDFTSGLPEYHDTGGDFEPMSRNDAVDAILGTPLRFEPGTGEAYSNSSYTLASVIVEEVTGQPFSEVVEGLLDDAGLRATGFYGSERVERLPTAVGHEGERHLDNDPASWDVTWALLGAGGMVSTVGDLHLWWDGLTGGTLLAPSTAALLEEHFAATQPVGDLELQGIGGTNDFGFDAGIVGLPLHEGVIVVVTNANPPERTIAMETGLVLAQLEAG